METLLAIVAGVLLPPASESSTSLRYLRPAGDRFVLESLVREVREKEGRTYTSLTDRGSEKMTITLHFDARNRLLRAEAAQETSRGKKSATVTFGEKEAVLTRGDKTQRVSVTPDVVVTTAPDWSDIFQVIRRYNRARGGKQEFAGLWIHPVQEVRQLAFTVEPVQEDIIVVEGKKVALQRYRVQLRSGGYLVWADREGRVARLISAGKAGSVVVLQGYEQATRGLR